jgi:transcription initiation factor TFIIIB Brf1 subunit/transcription initiation factor TFIIB
LGVAPTFRLDKEASVMNEKYVCLKCGCVEKSKRAFIHSHLRVYHRQLDELYEKAAASKKVD